MPANLSMDAKNMTLDSIASRYRPAILAWIAAALFFALGAEATASSGRGGGGKNDQIKEVYATVEEALTTLLPEADEIYKLKRVLEPAELRTIEKKLKRRLREGGYYVYVGLCKGEVTGYAFVTSEIGKVQPFTFMVGVEPDATVRDVVVMVYREAYGSEIRHRRFLNQLRGKSLRDPLRLNRDVVHISGATLSCNAIAAGVRKVLTVAKTLYTEQPQDKLIQHVRDNGTPVNVTRDLGRRSDRETGNRDRGNPDTGNPDTGNPDTGNPDTGNLDTGAVATRLEREHYVMGTTCRITAYSADRARGVAAVRAAFAEIARIDRLLSDYKPESELSRLSAASGAGPTGVSSELYALLRRVAAHHEAAGGAFDPTIRPLVEAWGFRRSATDERRTEPGTRSIDEAMARCGFDRIRFDDGAFTVDMPVAGMAIDPGAFGKGYALDRAMRVLRDHGIDRALIDFGSTALASGPPPGESSWRFAVRNPKPDGAPLAHHELVDQAISTSGSAERWVEIDGRRHSHILDPRTGRPVDDVASVTVLAGTALDADILSTAAAVLGSIEGPAYLADRGTSGVFLSSDHSPFAPLLGKR